MLLSFSKHGIGVGGKKIQTKSNSVGETRPNSRQTVPAQPVDATPPGINLFLKGGVGDAKTMEAIFGPTGRYVEPLEGWPFVKCDWSGTRQG
jgi:hypothetical protein